MASNQDLWTVNRLSLELNRDRRKLGIELRGCPVAKEKKVGANTEKHYRLADVFEHMLSKAAPTTSTGTDGADRLDPRQEQARLWVEQRRSKSLDNDAREGRLIPAAEVETEFAFLVKTFTGFLEQLPDILERDANISGAAVERLQQIVDRERARLYQTLVNRPDSGQGAAS